MSDLIADAVKLAVHEQTFGWDDTDGFDVVAELGTINAWVPDGTEADYSSVAAAGWIPDTAATAVTGRSVGLVSPNVVWTGSDVTFDTTGLGGDPLDGMVVYEQGSGLFIAFYDLSATYPGDATIVASSATGYARF